MTHEDFVFWSAIGMLANIPPQLVFGYLYLHWQRLARRPWVKYCFLAASIISFSFVMLRATGLLLQDNLHMRVISMWVFVGGSYYTAIMFALATRLVDRRITVEKIPKGDPDVKTSDLLLAVSCELREIVKHTNIKTNAHSHTI